MLHIIRWPESTGWKCLLLWTVHRGGRLLYKLIQALLGHTISTACKIHESGVSVVVLRYDRTKLMSLAVTMSIRSATQRSPHSLDTINQQYCYHS